LDEYKTIEKPASDTLIEKKSEFIGYIAPVSTEEAALAFIAEIRKKHSDAKHNVYAYILRGNNTTRFSDDGEPHGTAGLPVLELLRKEGLTDVVAVITRYFGGILLGTGGLLRAYTAAAKAAIDKTQIVIYKKFAAFSVTSSYFDYQKIDYYLQGKTVIREKVDFGTDVTLFLAAPCEDTEIIKNNINDISGGRAIINFMGERFDYINENK
jgi:uncharacterized YigZ family protein